MNRRDVVASPTGQDARIGGIADEGIFRTQSQILVLLRGGGIGI